MTDRDSIIPLREALAQIDEIRSQIAKATVFRGYRSQPIAATGCLAVLGAVAQAVWLPAPLENLAGYLLLWIGIAVLSVGLIGLQLFRHYAISSEFERQGIWQAVEQFAPCVLAGALLTVSLVKYAPGSVSLLPGLWAMFFSMGIFSSWRRLPRASFLIGGFYLAAGVISLACTRDAAALSPWSMGLTFGIGQLASAVMLYCGLERNHVTRE